MTSNPLVSVIMIFLNEERFIEEAIASVLAQTYDYWELLLVDDGSTDNSPDIALKYAEQYPEKVRYLEHEDHQNRGMSATRNLGIHHAQGELIAFLDGDDIYVPQKLERQVAILNSQPEAVMLYGQTMDWFSWTGNPEDSQRDLIYDLRVPTHTLIQPPMLFTLCLQRKAPTPCTCSAMMRREIFEEVGEFEESFRGLYEDQVFFMKIMLKAPIYVVDECWDKYRRRPDSCNSMARSTGQNRSIRLFFLNWLKTYLEEQGSKDKTVWKAFQEELWPYRHPIMSRLVTRTQGLVKTLAKG
jgi:glycosyltransferase involved in cell wall biosynthesis